MLLLQLVLLLLICAIALGWLARRFQFPYPIALVVGGALLGLIPGLPQFPFDPQLILVVVLPPVLYQAALLTSWPDFKANFRPIGLLAIGLVIATTLAVGMVFKFFIPSIPWAAAFVLGAIVSPPDAVAATTILSRLNIPKHIVTVLEGESLVNDASGLVIYKLAVAAVLTGGFSMTEAATQFAVVSAGGIGIGVLLAFVFIAIHRRLGDPFIEVLTVLVIPYATYIVAESVHVSGVLAVVAAGIVRGRWSPRIVSAEMRIMARSIWNILVFILNSLIFIVIGIQMSDVMDNLGSYPLRDLVTMGALVSFVAVAIRFAWVYPVAYLPKWLSGSLHGRGDAGRNRELAIISWCGMRGIVSLAAALALPARLPDGAPFPGRDLIVFLTFFVIGATLIGQGLTLAPLIRKLKVGSDWTSGTEARWLRSAMSTAALSAIDAHLAAGRAPAAWADGLRAEIRGRVSPEEAESAAREETQRTLRLVALKAERGELIRLWQESRISDELMRQHEELLDYQEAQL
jgi:Na+/H+ antiporter